MTEGPIYEKQCSRCQRWSWDSKTGTYLEICAIDGQLCDTDGGTFLDGEPVKE